MSTPDYKGRYLPRQTWSFNKSNLGALVWGDLFHHSLSSVSDLIVTGFGPFKWEAKNRFCFLLASPLDRK